MCRMMLGARRGHPHQVDGAPEAAGLGAGRLVEGRNPPGELPLVECRDARHLLGVQLEVEHGEVLLAVVGVT